MTAYILRNIDPSLWQRVKARAAGEGIQLRQLLMHLLRAYADGGISIRAQTNRHRTTGRYTDSKLDMPCICGHTLGMHTAERAENRQECLAAGCECERYTRIT
jgi:hypothetical protein